MGVLLGDTEATGILAGAVWAMWMLAGAVWLEWEFGRGLAVACSSPPGMV